MIESIEERLFDYGVEKIPKTKFQNKEGLGHGKTKKTG